MEYRARIKYYGREEGCVFLRRADFLNDERVTKVIDHADLIFVNNFAFESTVN